MLLCKVGKGVDQVTKQVTDINADEVQPELRHFCLPEIQQFSGQFDELVGIFSDGDQAFSDAWIVFRLAQHPANGNADERKRRLYLMGDMSKELYLCLVDLLLFLMFKKPDPVLILFPLVTMIITDDHQGQQQASQ